MRGRFAQVVEQQARLDVNQPEQLGARYARRRRETWWRNEMGDKQSHFKPAEQFRR
jgi:hypothetical protein